MGLKRNIPGTNPAGIFFKISAAYLKFLPL